MQTSFLHLTSLLKIKTNSQDLHSPSLISKFSITLNKVYGAYNLAIFPFLAQLLIKIILNCHIFIIKLNMCNVAFTKLVKLFVVFSGICAEINALNDENDLKLTLIEHKALEDVCIF